MTRKHPQQQDGGQSAAEERRAAAAADAVVDPARQSPSRAWVHPRPGTSSVVPDPARRSWSRATIDPRPGRTTTNDGVRAAGRDWRTDREPPADVKGEVPPWSRGK